MGLRCVIHAEDQVQRLVEKYHEIVAENNALREGNRICDTGIVSIAVATKEISYVCENGGPMSRLSKNIAAAALSALMLAMMGCAADAGPDGRPQENASPELSTETGSPELLISPEDDATVTPAVVNCGQMLFCTRGPFPEYQCFPNTGCTRAQAINDAIGDCAAVCGATACKVGFRLINCPLPK